MEASNLQIYWHESQPVYSLCFQPNSPNKKKLLTAGGDNKIRSWNLNLVKDTNKIDTIDFLSSLTQHEQAINVVKFNSPGTILASAGDDGQILLWKQQDVNEQNGETAAPVDSSVPKPFGSTFEDDEENNKESWFVWKRLRAPGSNSSEIYDLDWSPCDRYVVSGSMDNSIRVFDIESGKLLGTYADHNHYVQGVTWDPLNEFILSQSADRSVNIYQIIWDSDSNTIDKLKLKNRIMKGELPQRDDENDKTKLDYKNLKTSFLFHNESLPSFFRRLTISPCGSIFCIPAGIFKNHTTSNSNDQGEISNAVYIYTRAIIKQNSNNNRPVMILPFLKKPALVVSFNPNFYKLTHEEQEGTKKPYLKLPYRLIYAVATSNEVLIYDTVNVKPISIIGNLHYTALTDLSWSQDGNMLMVSSTDGFCSYITIEENLFGEKLTIEEREQYINANKLINCQDSNKNSSSSSSITPSSASASPMRRKTDIINILPVKRKIIAETEKGDDKSRKPKKESITVVSEKGSPSKEKKRIQPTLVNTL
ncbi:hypothetical protein NCAS_0B01020 [Naumovozyma castellii]|uniref:CAF1B/HIR1 beta-propeller domain-containing protein n=1 Tax=Naumovozyma castellii TaxID=27288 RepID=G0VB62_NAUCA|nr:hypothetical protein NCAS_0B01020 [Naumovozyma castellii CBS 4309]CCC68186.1 hypothetical protein NCAS_0B01020 [Naumovozyma castellii CBS 4309]